MGQIISLSVASQKLQPIINYFDDKIDQDVSRWHNAKDPLKQELYDHIDELAEEGREIQEQSDEGDTR